jgi:polyphenol oxidase
MLRLENSARFPGMKIQGAHGIHWLAPDWPAPPNVRALTTLRSGGVSKPPYASLNLAAHVGDDPDAVAGNRSLLLHAAALPAEPCWLEQVHGTRVIDAADWRPGVEADAMVAMQPGRVCVVLTADCLPVLICDVSGTRVAAVHAGWRGLAGGVIEAAIRALDVEPGRLIAWLGPAIGPDAFEVGGEVRARFTDADPAASSMFRPGRPGHWLADLFGLARLRLRAAGVDAIHGGGQCTVSRHHRYYSYRRDGTTGRMASLIWSV